MCIAGIAGVAPFRIVMDWAQNLPGDAWLGTDPFGSWNTQGIRRHSETWCIHIDVEKPSPVEGYSGYSLRMLNSPALRSVDLLGQGLRLAQKETVHPQQQPSESEQCQSAECQTAHKFGINEQSHSWFSFESSHFVEAQTLTEESTLTAGYHRPLLLLHQIQLPAGQRRQYLQ